MEKAAAYTDGNSMEEGGDFYWYIPPPYIFLDAIVTVKNNNKTTTNSLPLEKNSRRQSNEISELVNSLINHHFA